MPLTLMLGLFSPKILPFFRFLLLQWKYWQDGAAQLFIVWTNYKNLSYLQSVWKPNSWQACWSLFLGRFNFPLIYHPGFGIICLMLFLACQFSNQRISNLTPFIPWPVLVLEKPHISSENFRIPSERCSIHTLITLMVN